MNFIKEYGLTIGLVTFLFWIIFGTYYYYSIYAPKRDEVTNREQKILQDKQDAEDKKKYEANSILYRQ